MKPGPPPSQETQYEPADFTTCFLLQQYEFNVQSTTVESDYIDFFFQIYFFLYWYIDESLLTDINIKMFVLIMK